MKFYPPPPWHLTRKSFSCNLLMTPFAARINKLFSNHQPEAGNKFEHQVEWIECKLAIGIFPYPRNHQVFCNWLIDTDHELSPLLSGHLIYVNIGSCACARTMRVGKHLEFPRQCSFPIFTPFPILPLGHQNSPFAPHRNNRPRAKFLYQRVIRTFINHVVSWSS